MKLEGLTVNFLGDSITEGTGVTNVAENRYDNRLKRMYNLGATNNYGIGGTRLAHQEKPQDYTSFLDGYHNDFRQRWLHRCPQ